MVDKKMLANYPMKRIKPVDGLAVTAAIWEESHEYHRLQRQYHDLFRHGPGIITGLEVIASDPADSSVYILPGVALDSNGELIVLPEPVAFDFGVTKGQLYLLLSYSESRPEQEVDGGPLYIRAQFGIEALSSHPGDPNIELARLHRNGEAVITQATSPEFPRQNEIDLRFRPEIGSNNGAATSIVRIGVCYAGKIGEIPAGHGAISLAQELRNSGQRVYVDDKVTIGQGLETYTLVYLVAQEAFQFSRSQMNALYTYLQGGGTILMESCHRELADNHSPVDAAFTDLLTSFGTQVSMPPSGHPLLRDPYFFAAPPPGFETEGDSSLLVGDGLVISGNDYGCLWDGARRGRVATREEVRSAFEWGENLILYAQRRRQEEPHQ